MTKNDTYGLLLAIGVIGFVAICTYFILINKKTPEKVIQIEEVKVQERFTCAFQKIGFSSGIMVIYDNNLKKETVIFEGTRDSMVVIP